FHQNFCFSETLADYASANPGDSLFNAITATNGGMTVEILDGTLHMKRTGNSGTAAIASRTTNFADNPATMVCSFDLTVDDLDEYMGNAVVFQVGEGFGTVISSENASKVFSQFAIATKNDQTCRIKDLQTNTEMTDVITEGTYKVLWVMNRSGADFTYNTPVGGTQTVGNNRIDIWVGTVQVMDEAQPNTSSKKLQDFKIWYNSAAHINVKMDNFHFSLGGTNALGYGTPECAGPLDIAQQDDENEEEDPAGMLFHQNFCFSNTLSDYYNINGGDTLFNSISASGGSMHMNIEDGALHWYKTGNSSHSGIAVRTIDLGNPNTMVFSLDLTLDDIDEYVSNGMIFQIGEGFNTVVSSENNSKVYSSFAIRENNFGGFQIVDLQSGSTMPATFSEGTFKIIWALNKSGSDFSYPSPAGGTSTVGNGKIDLWFGTTQVMDEKLPVTAAKGLKNFKIWYNNACHMDVLMDNFHVSQTGLGALTYGTPECGPPYVAPEEEEEITIGTGGDYPSFTNSGGVFEYLNNLGAITENITLSVVSDITDESGENMLNQLTGMDQYHITIRPSAAEMRNVETVTTPSSNGLFVWNGADNMIVDGRAPGDNSEGESVQRYLTLNYKKTTGPTVYMLNGASNNIYRYVNIRGNSKSISHAVVFIGAAGSTANSDNTVEYCHIFNSTYYPQHGVLVDGTSGLETSNTVVRNNHIYNFQRAASSSGGITVGNNIRSLTIEGNHLYQVDALQSGSSATYVSIIAAGRAGAAISNVDSLIIRNNYIGGTAPYAGGSAWTMATTSNMPMRIRAIDIRNSAGYALVENNVINNFYMPFTRTSNTNEYGFKGIYINSGNADVLNNRIGSSDSLVFASTSNNTAGKIQAAGIEFAGTGGSVVGNTIQGMVGNVTGGGTYGIALSGIVISAGSADVEVRDNVTGSRTNAASFRISPNAKVNSIEGILVTNSGNNRALIHDNFIGGLRDSSSSTTSYVRGLAMEGTSGLEFYNDTIAGIFSLNTNSTWGTGQGVSGIYLTAHNHEALVHNNLIYDVIAGATSSQKTHASGITAAGSDHAKIYSNRIYSISNASSRVNAQGPTAAGINTGDKETGQVSIYNNMITLGLLADGSNDSRKTAFMGVWDSNDARSAPLQV
ncbi:MAG: hypothetical protein KDC13_07915, partial [Bacteroidetes bacterium]|nr:hypothetical protein [Bacteroidota bacterium]